MLPIPFALVIFCCVGVILALLVGDRVVFGFERGIRPTVAMTTAAFLFFVTAPSWYVATCYPDWYVSYAFDAGALPPGVRVAVGQLVSCAIIGGFFLGVWALQTRRTDALSLMLVGITIAFLIVSTIAGSRLGVVGSRAQFVSGVGSTRLVESGLGRAVFWGSLVQLAGFGYFVAALRKKASRDIRDAH